MNMKKLLLLSVLAAAFVAPAVAQNKKSVVSPNQVKTVNGVVEGTHEKSGVYSFKGLPFGAPPVGDLRWKEPQAVADWQGVRSAKAFGPRPMQANVFGDMMFRSKDMSEDCLYLNVWTAAPISNQKRPVLVWIYGGGFQSGGSAVPIYDGEAMSKKGIVFVVVSAMEL